MSATEPTTREGEGPVEPDLSRRAEPARQEPRPPISRPFRIAVEVGLIALILGLIFATILPVIVGRSKNADRFDFLAGRRSPPPTRH